MQSIINIIKLFLQKYAVEAAINWVLGLIAKLKTGAWKKEVDKATEAVKEAGTNPELTPEQKAKEQEDAFNKLNNTVNRP